ncbi:MAG: alpha/beta hydrolase [Holophagales bacterium]|nr:alpha/beta hydrolase [Holophagales bacterium]
MSELLSAIEQEPGRRAEASVIWMHGLGATAHDFETIPPELGLPESLAVRFVFPQAPSRGVTLNMGMVMPAWYDIRSLDGRDQDEKGIRTSEAQIRALVDREVERGVAPGRIVVGGFSQGGAMALQAGLRYPERLAGVMVLSGYLLLADRLDAEAAEANRGVSIFMAHGLMDPMVPHAKAAASRDHLQQLGYSVEWHDYPMAHQVCLPEVQAIGKWLTEVLVAP